MFRLNYVPPEKATGKIAEAYAVFPKEVGVPAPMQMMSASPELASIQSGVIKYFMNHQTLSRKLLTLIRFLSAKECDYGYCIAFNSQFLKAFGLTDVDLDNIQADPATAPLDDKEKALLLFVVKSLDKPEQVTDADVASLRAKGWTDTDIFDALYHGAVMRAPSAMFKVLYRP